MPGSTQFISISPATGSPAHANMKSTQPNALRLKPKRTLIPNILQKSNSARPKSLVRSNPGIWRPTPRLTQPFHHHHYQSSRPGWYMYIHYGTALDTRKVSDSFPRYYIPKNTAHCKSLWYEVQCDIAALVVVFSRASTFVLHPNDDSLYGLNPVYG